MIEPATARANGVGVVASPKNPHAALLFYEFEISEEGQKLLFERDFVPTHRSIETKLDKMRLKFVDARIALDDYAKWSSLYDATFGNRSK